MKMKVEDFIQSGKKSLYLWRGIEPPHQWLARAAVWLLVLYDDKFTDGLRKAMSMRGKENAIITTKIFNIETFVK
jgi:hypothetical protein